MSKRQRTDVSEGIVSSSCHQWLLDGPKDMDGCYNYVDSMYCRVNQQPPRHNLISQSQGQGCQALPAFSTINDRIKIVQIVAQTLRERGRDDLFSGSAESAVEQLSDPHFFDFKSYHDSIPARYASNMRKRGVDVCKPQSRPATTGEPGTTPIVSKKDQKIDIKFGFKDTCNEDDRTFDTVLRNLLVCFQAQPAEGQRSGVLEPPKQKRKVNQNSHSKVAKIMLFKESMTQLHVMAVQLKSMRMDQILDRYRRAESQLPALLRWTRLGVLHELFFNQKLQIAAGDLDIKDLFQANILDQQVCNLCQRIKQEVKDARDFDDIILQYKTQKLRHRSKTEGSLYRGVSRNGHAGWQIMCMVDSRQQFIATVDNVTMAAVIHDVISIQCNGLSVKTNFSYSKIDLMAIVCSPQLLDIKNVSAD